MGLRTRFAPIAAGLPAAILVLSLGATDPAPVLGHAGEMGLFVDPTSVPAGGVIAVRGDLPTTGPVELVLVNPQGDRTSLVVIEDAPNGHFDATLTVPASLAPGPWLLVAVMTGLPSSSAEILVTPGLLEGGRDPDDRAVVVPSAEAGSAASAQTPAAAADAVVASSDAPPSGWPVLAGVVAVLAVVAFTGAVVVRRRRRFDPST